MTRWHSTDEVRRFTKRHRFGAMARVLAARGIAYTLAADGEPLVVTGALDGKPQTVRNSGPRWDRIGA